MLNLDFVGKQVKGIVKGARHQVAPGIKEMNRRSQGSNHAAPWYGNRPGKAKSNALQLHMLDVEGYEAYEDYGVDEDYGYDA